MAEFQTFVHALFYLAAVPEYVGRLREEVEEVIREGWTKEALDQMYKVDSFIKESQRKTPLGNRECRSILCLLYADRSSRHDASCQEGLHIRGWHTYSTTVSVNPTQAHHDPEMYETPEQFKGFRFAKMRLQQDSKNMILLPPPQRSCLSDTGVMPVLDATSQLASSR